MTIKKRNRLIHILALHIARMDGSVAAMAHQAEAAITGHECTWQCAHRVVDDAERDTYNHLAGRRVYRTAGRVRLRPGLPRLRQELVEAYAEHRRMVEAIAECSIYRPHDEGHLPMPVGWEERALERARREGVLSSNARE